MNEINSEDFGLKKRVASSKSKILDMLRAAGKNGVLNTQLQEASLRYGGILGALYTEGYVIENQHVEGGVYLYTLIEEPKVKLPKPASAEEIVFAEIRKGYGGHISAGELRKMLEDYGFHIIRKGGSHMRKRSTVRLTELVAGDNVRLECTEDMKFMGFGNVTFKSGRIYEGKVVNSFGVLRIETHDEQGDIYNIFKQDVLDQHFKVYKEVQ